MVLSISKESRRAKLVALAESEGYPDVQEFLQAAVYDSVCPGICITATTRETLSPTRTEAIAKPAARRRCEARSFWRSSSECLPHASAILPDVGDGLFDLFLFDEGLDDFLFDSVLAAGDPFAFGPEGISRFRILGIELDAALDPNDATAFVTGLTFVESGEVIFTQTPIQQQVSEPATWYIMVVSLIVLSAFCHPYHFRR